MERFKVVWHWTKQISGITVATCLSLYTIRCVVTVHILTLLQWEQWFNKFAYTIFSSHP